jgi:hypothetical protein
MGEAGVLGAGKGEASQPELANSTEPLHLRCFEETKEDRLFLVLEADETVDRVAEQHIRGTSTARAGPRAIPAARWDGRGYHSLS